MRRVLPTRRKLWTQKVKIAEQTCYLTCGEYEDGTLGEIFLDVNKQGSFVRGALDSLAKCFSIALQCGAELQCLTDMLKESNFPPSGPVLGSASVFHTTSVIDWVARELEARYGNPR